MPAVAIMNNGSNIGELRWDEHFKGFELVRLIDGVELRLPMQVWLKGFDPPSFDKLRSNLLHDDGKQRASDISCGVQALTCDLCEFSKGEKAIVRGGSPNTVTAARQDNAFTVSMRFALSLATVAALEKLRDNGDLKLSFSLSGTSFWLIRDVFDWRSAVAEPYPFEIGRQLATIPREAWAQAVRAAGLAETILVELPLLREARGAWAGVWDQLVAARDAFDKGMWTETVVRARLAFDVWQKIEVNAGRSWELSKPASNKPVDLDAITKDQRLRDLLIMAKRFTDRSVHPRDEVWTRDDAVVATALCTALWNALVPHDGAAGAPAGP